MIAEALQVWAQDKTRSYEQLLNEES